MDWGKSCDGECSSCKKERRKEEEEKTDAQKTEAQIIIELREEVKFLKEYHKREMNRLMENLKKTSQKKNKKNYEKLGNN